MPPTEDCSLDSKGRPSLWIGRVSMKRLPLPSHTACSGKRQTNHGQQIRVQRRHPLPFTPHAAEHMHPPYAPQRFGRDRRAPCRRISHAENLGPDRVTPSTRVWSGVGLRRNSLLRCDLRQYPPVIGKCSHMIAPPFFLKQRIIFRTAWRGCFR